MQIYQSRHLLLTICTLIAILPYVSVSNADEDASKQIIGLCYRDGSSDIVLEEILRTEGVPYVRLHNLEGLDTLDLKGLIIGQGFDSSARRIEVFMDKGGALLCVKPGGPLAKSLGLKTVGEQNDGYLRIEGECASLVAYEGQLQLCGQTRLYEGGECLARLDPKAGNPKNHFAGIIRVKRGPASAVVVSIDLPATILHILQPESESGKHVDTSSIEYDLGDAPQVDLMRRLIVGLFLKSVDIPLMRKWYFPSQHKAMLALLGDQDGATFEMMQAVRVLLEEIDAPYTLFILQGRSAITREQFDLLAKSGIEYAVHPNFFAPGGLGFSEDEFKAQLKKAESDIGGKITGQRPHSGRWQSVRELPMWCERAGVQYDAILGERWWKSRPAKLGYWVGTGLPYNFLDPDNYRRMDVLEIPITTGDNLLFCQPRKYPVQYKQGAHKALQAGLGLSEDEAFELYKRFLDTAIKKYHTVAGCQCHPIYLSAKRLETKGRFHTDAFFRKCVKYAKSKGVGLTGTNALNDFWRARDKVSIEPIAWDGEFSSVRYRLSGDVKVDSLSLITPLYYRGKKASIFINGCPLQHTSFNCLGEDHAMFSVDIDTKEELSVTVIYK